MPDPYPGPVAPRTDAEWRRWAEGRLEAQATLIRRLTARIAALEAS